jgi:hypothetical protein
VERGESPYISQKVFKYIGNNGTNKKRPGFVADHLDITVNFVNFDYEKLGKETQEKVRDVGVAISIDGKRQETGRGKQGLRDWTFGSGG